MTNRISPPLQAHRLDHGKELGTHVPERLRLELVVEDRKLAFSRVNRWLLLVSKCDYDRWVTIPRGSAFLNLFDRGCRSRFGSDCTKRRVCVKLSATLGAFRKEMSYIFAANGLDDIIWWCTKKLCDNGELIDVIFAGE